MASSLIVRRSPSPQRLSVDPDTTVQFENVYGLYQMIESFAGDFLIVTEVSLQDYSQIETERQSRHENIRFRRYHADTGMLVITIPTDLHEALHLDIYRRFEHQLVLRGMQNKWRPIGSTTFRTQGHPGGDGGEGDSSGGPRLGRNARGTWPKLVIEAGDSESMHGLHDDTKWWFSRSNHEVKIVLLAKFERREQMIILERWQEELSSDRSGAATTRLVAVLEPRLQQRITITQNTSDDPMSYNVSRGALVLSGTLLFGPTSQVQDFIISVDELGEYARCVWEVV